MASKFWADLDAANNEADVRRRLAEGLYHSTHRGIAEEWLRSREAQQAVAAEERQEMREEAQLSIAVEALSNSRLATRLAALAIVVSLVVAAFEIVKWLSK